MAAAAAQAQSIHADFDNIAALAGQGWVFINASVPVGTTGWYQGSLGDFPPQASPGFIESNYLCGSGVAVQNNWMLLPMRRMQNGETLDFWTRTLFAPAPYPDRLQVRLSQADTSTNIGSVGVPTSVGDFATLLLDINPQYSPTGFPGAWTLYSVELAGLPEGGVTGRLAFRYFVENGGPMGIHGAYVGIDTLDYLAGTGTPVGACCLFDGTCQVQSSIGCAGLGGAYQGDDVPCASVICPAPPAGSCCRPDGTCVVVTSVQCAAGYGVYGGDNSPCTPNGCQPFGFVETVDAGGLTSSSALIGGPGAGPLTRIYGHIASDTDMYRIRICDHAVFSASTLTGILDTQLCLFDLFGRGVVMDDDGPLGEPGSIITGAAVPFNGQYFLSITLYNRDALDSQSRPLWLDTNPAGAYYPEWTPNGLGAANPVSGWTGASPNSGDYTITLTGTCFGATTCYVNCDFSSGPPILNANDFQCFLNRFGIFDPYANCDGSTANPILTANDFQCFLNAFATGCS